MATRGSREGGGDGGSKEVGGNEWGKEGEAN
jgi:hypothetical protein